MKKFGGFDDEAQKLGLKRIMPKGIFGHTGTFRGVAHADYMALRKANIGYLEDKPLPSGQVPTLGTDLGNMTADVEDETWGDKTWDDVLAYM